MIATHSYGRSVSTRRGALLLGLLLLAGSGCGGGSDARYPVSGRVQVGNEPVRGGFVIIEPAGGTNGGRQGYAKIRDGKFDTRDGGEPAAAGPVVVRVQGWGAPSEQFPDGVPLCTAYEVRTELEAKANTLDLTVPESARVKEPKGGWGERP